MPANNPLGGINPAGGMCVTGGAFAFRPLGPGDNAFRVGGRQLLKLFHQIGSNRFSQPRQKRGMLANFDAKPFGLFCEKHAGWIWWVCRFRMKLTKRWTVFQTVKRFAGDAGYGALTYLTSAKPLCLLVDPIVCLMFYSPVIQVINVKTHLGRRV